MNKLLLIDLGTGSLREGFPRITVEFWKNPYQTSIPTKRCGSLPAIPELVWCYEQWQKSYPFSYKQDSSLDPPTRMKIYPSDISNFSMPGFNHLCLEMGEFINDWLKSEDFFQNIEQPIRQELSPDDELQVIIQTNDHNMLRRIPWHLWQIFEDFPNSEVALSAPEWQAVNEPRRSTEKIRILAVFGDKTGINLGDDRDSLLRLEGTEIVFLDEPEPSELASKLKDSEGWDILFYAGHSHTEERTGWIQLNSRQSLSIVELQQELDIAINNGLQLAIFNSCDGLGLAQQLEKLNIPQVIVMRERVLDSVAQAFLSHLLNYFSQGLSLFLALRKARQKLKSLKEYPCASWFPVLIQNPTTDSPTWETLQRGSNQRKEISQAVSKPFVSKITWEEKLIRAARLANSCHSKGSDRQALHAYNALIVDLPDDLEDNIRARLYSYRGAMLKRLHRFQEAENDLLLARKWASKKYEMEDISWNLACIYAMLDDKQKLVIELNNLIYDQQWRTLILSRHCWFGKFLEDPDIRNLLRGCLKRSEKKLLNH